MSREVVVQRGTVSLAVRLDDEGRAEVTLTTRRGSHGLALDADEIMHLGQVCEVAMPVVLPGFAPAAAVQLCAWDAEVGRCLRPECRHKLEPCEGRAAA
jgi:hypothetical protein